MTKKELQNQERKLNALLDLAKEQLKQDQDNERKQNIIEGINTNIFLYNVYRKTFEQVIANLIKILLVDYNVSLNDITNVLGD